MGKKFRGLFDWEPVENEDVALLNDSTTVDARNEPSPQHKGLFIPAPAVAEIEKSYWDAEYRFKPQGDIALADVLMNVFLYISLDKKGLVSVGNVCRSWRERTNYLPQWNKLVLWRFAAEHRTRT